MSQTKTNLRMIDIGTITPLDFGANGDGTSNDAATLQLALDSTSNSVLDLAGKTYAFESALTITRSNLIIKNGTLKFTGTNAGEFDLVSVNGSVGSTNYTPSADLKVGSNEIDLPGATVMSAFSVDTYLVIQGTVEIYDGTVHSTTTKQAEIVKVRKVDTTNTKLFLYSPLKGNYKTTEVDIHILTPRENITFENVTFEGKGVTEYEIGASAITTNSGNTTINVVLPGTGLGISGSVLFLGDIGSTAIGGVAAATLSGSELAVTGSSEGGGNTTVNATFVGSNASSNASGGDATSKAYYGGNEGIRLNGCANVTIKDCTFKKLQNDIEAYYTNNLEIKNNKFVGFNGPIGRGIYIRQAVTTVFIEENKFLGNHNYGVYAYDPAGLPKDIYIKGNYFSGIRDAAAYVYIVNSLTFVNNKVENSPILTSDKTGAIHSGLRYYGFELTCTDNEFTGFGKCGVYWEPRYKAINTASTQSAYSGGHNNNVYSDAAAGQTWSYPSAVIANNRLKGRAGDTSLSSKGIEIVPKTINFGIWGCSLTQNLISTIGTGISIDASTGSPSGISTNIRGLKITDNQIFGERNSGGSTGLAVGIHFKGGSGSDVMQRGIIANNIIQSYSPGYGVTNQQVDPLIQLGASGSNYVAGNEGIINSNSLYGGTYSIFTGGGSVPSLKYGIVIGNMFSSHSNETNATYAYGPLNSGSDPIGVASGTNAPAIDSAIQNITGGIVNNFYSDSYTGG